MFRCFFKYVIATFTTTYVSAMVITNINSYWIEKKFITCSIKYILDENSCKILYISPCTMFLHLSVYRVSTSLRVSCFHRGLVYREPRYLDVMNFPPKVITCYTSSNDYASCKEGSSYSECLDTLDLCWEHELLTIGCFGKYKCIMCVNSNNGA